MVVGGPALGRPPPSAAPYPSSAPARSRRGTPGAFPPPRSSPDPPRAAAGPTALHAHPRRVAPAAGPRSHRGWCPSTPQLPLPPPPTKERVDFFKRDRTSRPGGWSFPSAHKSGGEPRGVRSRPGGWLRGCPPPGWGLGSGCPSCRGRCYYCCERLQAAARQAGAASRLSSGPGCC